MAQKKAVLIYFVPEACTKQKNSGCQEVRLAVTSILYRLEMCFTAV